MIYLEIFKYNSLISVPLFAFIGLLLIKNNPNFSFSHYTISKSIFFLSNRTHRIIFRLNFLLKALLDLGFAWFVIHHFNISYKLPVFWSLILSFMLFGSLSYFVEGKFPIVHKVITYSGGILWLFSQTYLSLLTKDVTFIRLTNIITAIVFIVAFGFMFAKRTNVIVQALCMFLLYSWLLIFVFLCIK